MKLNFFAVLSSETRRPVAALSVKNNEFLPDLIAGKTIRVDARLDFNNGEKADLEMQMRKTSDDLKRRALVYGSKLLFARLFAMFPPGLFYERGTFLLNGDSGAKKH
jgi:hypothetical protein